MKKKSSTFESLPVFESIPEGWRALEEETTAPNGYLIIAENKSRFTPEGRKIALLKVGNYRICHRCGKVIFPAEGYYHEIDKDHCEDCHPDLYPDEKKWDELCTDGLDDNEEPIIGDDYFYSEVEE